MYHNAVRTMVLAKVIKLFFEIIYNDDTFLPSDLFDPKPNRTRRFYFLLIEFYYASNEHAERIIEIENTTRIKREAKEKMLENCKQLQVKIGNVKLENAENQIRVEQELERIEEEKNKLQKCQDIRLTLKSQMEALKMDISTLITAKKDAELEVIEGKERTKVLSSQVVQVTEHQEIQERDSKVASHQSVNQEKRERLTELKHLVQTSNATVEVLNNQLLVMLQDIQQEVTKNKEIQTSLSQLDQDKAALLEGTEDNTMQIQHLTEQLASRQGKVSQMRQSWNLKQESIIEDLNQLKLVLEQVRQSRTEEEIVSQEMETERMRIMQDIQQLNGQTANIGRIIAANYKKIIDTIEKHNNDLQVSLADLAQCMEQSRVKNPEKLLP
ncbi:uncharacterized protein alr4393-like isoform X2 [Homarus americanus]|nr:uncharacterized protein alr4393-like isoform X2 [Homarus americanus]